MPHSRDVDSFPDDMLQIAAIMRTNKDFTTEWMPVRLAKRVRYQWYAFVRAHYHTIERGYAVRVPKDALAKERVAPIQNLLMTNRAREARLDVIKKFEAILEYDMEAPELMARIRFRNKSIPLAPAGIQALFNALPQSQQRFEEDIQIELESPTPRNYSAVASSAPEADLSEFFSMPMDEKIRLGIASINQEPSPASPIASNSPESPAQLDSGPRPAYPTLAIGGERTDVPDAPQVSDPLTKEE